MKVNDLIEELEKHKGKQVYVTSGMFLKDIVRIDVEEAESNIVYLVTEK